MDLIAVVLAAEEAQETGIAGTFGLNLKLFLAQLVNFGLLAVALWYLLFKPLTRHMAERSKRIEEGLENANNLDKKLAKLEEDRLEIIKRAEIEASQVLARADNEAKKIVVEAGREAEKKVEAVREKAVKELASAKEQMINEVKQEAASLVVLATEKVLREKVDKTTDEKLVARALKEVN